MKIPLPQWTNREITNDFLPISTIIWIGVGVVVFVVVVFGSISYGRAQSGSLGPRVSEAFSPPQRSTALELTRISASTGVRYDAIFEIYKQNLEQLRVFDKGWNAKFATFDRLWNARCFEPVDPVPCTNQGPLVQPDAEPTNGHSE